MTGPTTLRIPDPLKAEATAYADSLGVSFNALCAIALRDYLDTPKRKPAGQPAKDFPRVFASPQRAQAHPSAALGGTTVPKVGANQPCPCGSGKKYKQCHGRPGASS
jgi:hypothetical protein